MFYTYILYSSSIGKYYIGYTENLDLRLERHNSGWGKYSSKGISWKLVYYESFHTKTEAIKKENEIKRMKSRKYIEGLILNGKSLEQGGRPD